MNTIKGIRFTGILSAVALSAFLVLLGSASATANNALTTSIEGDYVEVRSCDVYTGSCFANAEMGLSGREAIMAWSIREGAWNGVPLDGLSVVAVVVAPETLGDVRVTCFKGVAELIIDENASVEQAAALRDMARSLTGGLTEQIVETRRLPVTVSVADCSQSTCASVQAGSLVNVTTRCLGSNDHVCGNEEVYYPPLTKVDRAYPAFTTLAAYTGDGLGTKWSNSGQRSAFIGTFSL